MYSTIVPVRIYKGKWGTLMVPLHFTSPENATEIRKWQLQSFYCLEPEGIFTKWFGPSLSTPLIFYLRLITFEECVLCHLIKMHLRFKKTQLLRFFFKPVLQVRVDFVWIFCYWTCFYLLGTFRKCKHVKLLFCTILCFLFGRTEYKHNSQQWLNHETLLPNDTLFYNYTSYSD